MLLRSLWLDLTWCPPNVDGSLRNEWYLEHPYIQLALERQGRNDAARRTRMTMSIKKILMILAAGFVVSFLAVPAYKMMTITPDIQPPSAPEHVEGGGE